MLETFNVKSLPQEIWNSCFDNCCDVVMNRVLKCMTCTSKAFQSIVLTYQIHKANQGKQVAWLGIKDELAFSLQNKDNLVRIKFSSDQAITDACMEKLGKLTQLRSIEIGHCLRLTDAGLQKISNLINLTNLKLCNCWQITDLGLQHLSRLTALKQLNIGSIYSMNEHGSKDVLKGPDQAQNFKFISHSDRQITDSGLQHLLPLTALQELKLSFCDKISTHGLQQLSVLVNLTKLGLKQTEICDDDITSLSFLTKLEQLSLASGTCTAKGLQHLRPLQHLRKLNLLSCNLDDDAVIQLTHLTSLQTLNLNYCFEVTDESIQQLKHLQMLKMLSLCGNDKITTEGILHLSALNSLVELNLICCDEINPRELQRSFPNVKIRSEPSFV